MVKNIHMPRLMDFCYNVSMNISIAEAIIINNGKVLLVQQRKQSAYALWSYPGGRVEDGESLEEAVYREVGEELSVKLINTKLFKTHRLETPTGELELNSFTGELEGDIVLKDDELMAYGWFSLDSLEAMHDKLRAPIVLTQAKEALQVS